MPFVKRVVEPKFVSRTSLHDDDGKPKVLDQELQAITNCTLSNALRQLASLVLLAEDIFSDLTSQLEGITERSKDARTKLEKIGQIVEKYDPKTVTVPEGSLSDFAVSKVHYTAKLPLLKGLFTPDSRPPCLRKLYEAAVPETLGKSPLEDLRKDCLDSSFMICTPILTTKRRKLYQKINADIEIRIPTVVENLRKWTSKEAMGEVTALPDASMRITSGVTLTPDELSECGSGDDEPIDHRLPSPEEQLSVIASKFPPEMVTIDTSGKFFDRMCTSRKSLTHVEGGMGETDTVKRRTRSRKPRGKRRNTISGTDQKELREAIAGDSSIAVASEELNETKTVIRSHSSDLLKKSPNDTTTVKKSHFNSLKQWGKSRLKMIGRSPSASRDSFKDLAKLDKKEARSSLTTDESPETEVVTLRRRRSGEEERKSLQRCGSYSSSEKSIGVPVSTPTTATIGNGVKLRATSIQRRLRRSALLKDEPHSSSGNWSASSESGRTSIGSEITSTTVPPKSTTSAGTSINSLNYHHGPPSSIISRRRFLNTSGSGSVTSEGTLTPDIIQDMHDDIETSSEFSCDTEGYYTSFHMDSGLKTLKEEELSPCSPMHTSNALSNSLNNQTLTAENEYELFGKGSTSTTTSSAGTVCTTLMAAGSDRSLIIGPMVPERKSSLTKINRRSSNIHSANASLDRSLNASYAKSPFNSLRYNSVVSITDKKKNNLSSPDICQIPTSTITITQNVGNPMTAVAEVHTEIEIESAKKSTGTSSPDSGHNTSSSPIEDSISSAHGKTSLSEQDYSESSDLEGFDRIERIKYKTTINSSRIPSLCVITPNNSDDESESCQKENETNKYEPLSSAKKSSSRPKLDLPSEEIPKEPKVEPIKNIPKSHNNLKTSLLPLNNLMCKLKGVLPKSSSKKSPTINSNNMGEFNDAGDYVTIADVTNNNRKINLNRGTYANNDTIRRNLQNVLSGKLPDTEYVSLNELPNSLNVSKECIESVSNVLHHSPAIEEIHQKGAKVTLDSQGQVIYSSDTLKRRKGAHTTFEPGPFVQEHKPTILQRNLAENVKITDETDFPYDPTSSKPTSPQLGKVVIKAPAKIDGPVTKEFLPLPSPKPSTIITATPITETPKGFVNQNVNITNHKQDLPRIVDAVARTGAYVNINDAEGVSLSPTKDNTAGYRRTSADRPSSVSPNVISNTEYRIDKGPVHSPTTRLNSAQLRGRNGRLINNNQPMQKPVFWTLPKLSPQHTIRSLPDKETFLNIPTTPPSPAPSNQFHYPPRDRSDVDESIRISPIDPRNIAPFKSSTPSNKEIHSSNLSTKLLSPVKSTMSNEELYAVIHKSKKKLNIKDTAERSNSPALSTASISPVNSESSLYSKIQRYPETGYFSNIKSLPSENYTHTLPYPSHKSSTTCADRYGPVPQTSRLDFKKLLLQHSVKLNTLNPQNKSNKISAVEQLKISKDKLQSPTPPTYMPSSHSDRSQVNILDLSGSPKTYSQRRIIKNVINHPPSSPNRTNNLIKEFKIAPKVMLSPKSQWRFASPRSDVISSPIPEANNEDDASNSSGDKSDIQSNPSPSTSIAIYKQFGARRSLIPITENQDGFSDKQDNVAINISTRPTLSRAEMIQAKRAEFFNNSPPKISTFKNTMTYPRISTGTAVAYSDSNQLIEEKPPSPTDPLETAL